MSSARTITLHVRGAEFTLAPDNVSIAEKSIIRKAIGCSYEVMLSPENKGEEQLVMLWWIARRGDGEVGLTWARALEEWPSDLTPEEFADMVTEGDATEDDSPEA